jgi:hypothetical protein
MKPPRRLAPVPAPPDPVRGDDELDFAALMRRDGVVPVATDRRAAPARPTAVPANSGAKAVATRAAPAAGPATKVATMPGSSTPTPAVDRAASRATSAASPRSPIGPDQVLTRERDAALLATAALRAEHAALVAGNLVLTRERDAALLASTSARVTEAALRAELGAARSALRAAHEVVDPPRISLAAALLARGLEGATEQARALAVLTDGEAATRLLELLETRDPAALASLLERRLALVCGDPGCAPEVGAAALQVARARCEVCGGSDIQRAAHGFVRACAAAAVVRVRFVGGSPNYRTKLAALFPGGGPLTVHTTAGDKRVRLSRSRSQQRGDDLVIIWGATELDHATSGVYRAEHGRTEVIAHRGIGRMLELAAARIAGAPAGAP